MESRQHVKVNARVRDPGQRAAEGLPVYSRELEACFVLLQRNFCMAAISATFTEAPCLVIGAFTQPYHRGCFQSPNLWLAVDQSGDIIEMVQMWISHRSQKAVDAVGRSMRGTVQVDRS
jgi:hypothetical protein